MRTLVRRLSQEPVAAKVPEITAMFWVLKLATTYMGEATSDWFGDIPLVIGGAAEVLILAVAVWCQFRSRRYVAPAYWGLAMAIAIFGCGVSDTLHVVIGIPYAGTTALWAIVLAVIFWRWHHNEGTLSIHSITTHRREMYYWATVFATFALGTAAGDLTAIALKLGFLTSGLLFGAAILVPLVAWWRGLNEVAAFWIAYVLTRPLGASFADYVSKSHKLSGAGFGDFPTALTSAIVLVVLVAYVAVTRRDIQEPAPDLIRADDPDPVRNGSSGRGRRLGQRRSVNQ